jgi:L-iditol 2-dehydrogenase
MRAAVMYDVDDIRIEERPLPRIEAGDVLVRAAASGICSGDLMPWYVRRKAPFVFGHEPAGTIVAVGADAPRGRDGRTFAVGDRLFAHHHAPCFTCDFCERGEYVHCAVWRGSALDPGGMAEYFRVPRANLADAHVLPPELSFADGALVEPLGCVVKSLRRAQPAGGYAGRTLYAIGAGVMGLMHVAVASARGARVFASDFHAKRLALARELGAESGFAPESALEALRAKTEGRGADAVICGPGSAAALAHALEAVAPDGAVLMFTPLEPGERFAFDQNAAYFRDVRLIASYSCGPDDTREALDLLRSGVVSARRLGAASFPFPAAGAAYEAMRRAEVVKAIVTFEDPAPS